MSSFSPKFLQQIMFHPSTAWYISQCTEARGMQELWKKVRPEVLKNLRESALIQSTESSNRIEGVTVDPGRLLPLILGNSTPQNRSEEEISGYRKALSHIHLNHKNILITPSTIKELHLIAQGGMISDAGKWKEKDNDIIEILPNGERIIRFIPVPAGQTPKKIEQLCLAYNDVLNNSKLPELANVGLFILDFLCIHPFRDGNGRVSRLLTLLLLYQCKIDVGRYISIEKIIESTKEDYYRVLHLSSTHWHQDQHDILPWLNYFLSTIKTAYQDLKERVELFNLSDDQSSILKQTMATFLSPFSISDIQHLHPNINRNLIKKVLHTLSSQGVIIPQGRARATKWIWIK